MKIKKLLVVGELNIDLILNDIQGFPEIGTEIVANSMNFTLGSSSAIMASNTAALGVPTSFCGMIGTDDFGDYVLKQLQSKGVDTRLIQKVAGEKTGITIVMNYAQDRANVTYCGAMDHLSLQSIPWEQLKQFDHFHLSNYFLQKGLKNELGNIFKKAKEAGLSTSLDLQWDPENRWELDYKSLLPYVDVFLPNEAEILALTRTQDIESALEALKPFANILALKMGEKGGLLVSGDTRIEKRPFLNKAFKDAIGAGDSFNAGFIQKYLQGAPLDECLLNANLMGSLSTTESGGTTAFSSQEAIESKTQQILNHQL